MPTANVDYLPLIVQPDGCFVRPGKKGVAFSYPYWEFEQIYDDLCLSANPTIRTWWPAVGPEWVTKGVFLPNLWGETNFNAFVSNVPAEYTGLVLIANEPDQSDQANMSPTETAALFVAAHNHCPGCQLVGPGLASDEIDGQWRLAWWLAYLAQGGPAEFVVAWDAHQYFSLENAQIQCVQPGAAPCPIPTAPDYLYRLAQWEMNRRLDVIQQVMPVSRPVVVSEVGGCAAWWYIRPWIRGQLETLESRPDVWFYNVFIDSDYYPYQPCPYPIYAAGGELNEYGLGIREVNQP